MPAALRSTWLWAVGVGVIALALPAFKEGVPSFVPLVGLVAFAVGVGLAIRIWRRDPGAIADPRAWRRFKRNRGALVGLGLVGFVGAVAFVGPLLSPHDPDRIYDEGVGLDGTPSGPAAFIDDAPPISLSGPDAPPLGERLGYIFGGARMTFVFGADNIGRDELSRLLHGGRISLSVAMGAVAIAGTLGFCAGLIGGYFRGTVDASIIQVINFVLSLPFLLVAITLNRVIDDPSLFVLCVLLGFLSWTTLARVTRAKTQQVRELEYVQAARALGMSDARIMFRHIVPNVMGPAIVIVTTLIAQMIIVESAMSFLGLGVKPPTASWGSMLRDGQEYLTHAPRLLILPAILIVMTVFGFNLLGEGLRDALDPKE